MNNWIIISVSLNIFSTLLLSVIYSIIYFQDRNKHIKYWAYAWIFYCCRFIMMFWYIYVPNEILHMTNQITALFSGFFLVKGTSYFLKQKFSKIYSWLLWPIIAWIIVGELIDVSFLLITLPTFIYLGFTFIIHGIAFLRKKNHQLKTLYNILGWTFIVWGLHKMDYPVLRSLPHAAVWGYTIAFCITFVISVCIILAHYETQKQKVLASEKRYRTYIETAPFGIFVVNSQGKYIDVNAKASEITGYTKQELLNLSIPDLLHPSSLPAAKKHFETVLKNGHYLNPPPQQFEKKDGSIFSGTVTAVQIGPDSFLGFLNDTTEFENIQNEKNNIQEQLIQSAKLASIGELAAGVGHEINNPLTIITSYLEIIKRKIEMSDFDTLTQILDTQEQAAKRIATIVKGLRTLARSDSDIIEKIGINQSIKNIISMLQVIYQKSGIVVNTVLSPDEIFIDGNQAKFQQVIVNLLSNAKDALQNGSNKKINIETTTDNKNALLIISDNGSGIPSKNINRIFDSFFTTKGHQEGSGLGLSIVKTIIQNISGTIDVQSQPNIGTTFKIAIPLSQKYYQIKDNTKKDVHYAPLSGNILVVDDEEDIREILITYLEEFGLTSHAAENGKVALEMIQRTHYDAILTDINMPIMGGDEFIKKARQLKDFNSPIFVITGAIKIDSIDIPQERLISKPFDKKQIYESICKCYA